MSVQHCGSGSLWRAVCSLSGAELLGASAVRQRLLSGALGEPTVLCSTVLHLLVVLASIGWFSKYRIIFFYGFEVKLHLTTFL